MKLTLRGTFEMSGDTHSLETDLEVDENVHELPEQILNDVKLLIMKAQITYNQEKNKLLTK